MKDNTINLNKLKLFSGLYNTIWLNDALYENLKIKSDSISINIDEYLENIGKLYCKYFKKNFNLNCYVHSTYGQEIILQFKELPYEVLEFIKNTNGYDFELYDIYNDLYGYELFQNLIQVGELKWLT